MTVSPAEPQIAGGGVQSVLSALDVLDCLAAGELGVTQVARRLGVAKSTAHRLLTTLCARGLVEQNAKTGNYHLGVHLFELGQLARECAPLHGPALPLLQELRQATGQTVHLCVADGANVIVLERLDSSRAIPLPTDGTRRMPVHATSAGLVLAAFDEEVARARTAAGFPAMTARTVTSGGEFERALERIRREGYAAVDGEAVEGLASVAVPVRDWTGRIRAALSVSGPSLEIVPGAGRFVAVLAVTSAKLSRAIGA